MGADDGDHGAGNKPHPSTNNPKLPCGERPTPDFFLWDCDLPRNRPPVVARRQQVAETSGYAVAGKILLAAAGALAGVLLALVAMHLYNRARQRRLGDGGGGRRRLDRSLAIAGVGEDRDDGSGAAAPRGLDPAVLRALPVAPAGAGAGDCAVCLAELQPGEKARALPRCGHAFHAECIDAWFQGNATCPLCRADVVAPDATVEVRVDVASLRADNGAAAAKASVPPAMGRLPSGTDLDKTRRAVFASTRSVSF